MKKYGRTEALKEAFHVAKRVIVHCRWILVTPCLGVLLALTLDWGSLVISFGLLLHCVAGLIGSYALHEASHAFTLKLCPEIIRIRVDAGLLRFSLRPVGTVTARQALITAVLGPTTCVCAGTILYFIPPTRHFCWWYLGHAVFLLPLFGDGQSAFRALRLLCFADPKNTRALREQAAKKSKSPTEEQEAQHV